MPSKPAIQYAAPAIHESVPFEVRRHLQFIYNRLGNHAQAFQLQTDQIAAIKTRTTATSTTFISGGGGGGTVIASNILAVDNQTGVTTYQTQSGDNGALVVLNDASPVAVTLAGSTPPYGLFLVNQGAGLVTLTPAAPPTGTSTISYPGVSAAASMPLASGYGAIVGYDGSDWYAMTMPIVPESFTHVTHEWLDSYDASTGLFTASQPAYSDISGTPQLANTIAPVTGEYLTGYDATTGNFSQSTTPGIGATIVTAALTPGGTQGSMTFVDGILTAQTPAT